MNRSASPITAGHGLNSEAGACANDCPQGQPLPEAYENPADFRRDTDRWYGRNDPPRPCFEDSLAGWTALIALMAVSTVLFAARCYCVAVHGQAW